MDKIENLIMRLKEGNSQQIQTSWTQMLKENAATIEGLNQIIKILNNRGQKRLALDIIEETEKTCAEAKNFLLWTEVLKILAECNPSYKDLAIRYAYAFQKNHADQYYLGKWIEKVAKKKFPTLQFIKTLEKLLIF
jgi:hypothetical protein